MKTNYFGPPPYLSFFENGSVLSHEDQILDCAAAQQDVQTVIDVCMTPYGTLLFGTNDKSCAYVANVIIPGRQFTSHVVIDKDGEEHEELVAMPLDMNQVTGNLWTLPAQTTKDSEEK